MKIFKASFDKLTLIISFVFISFIVVLFILNLINNSLFLPQANFSLSLGFYFLAILFLYILLFIPKYYSVDASAISIHRPIFSFKINRSEIAACSVILNGEMRGVIRVAGNGGLFGYTGFFWNTKYGTMRWFATQRKNYVLIEKTNGNKIVITPDEPEKFIEALG